MNELWKCTIPDGQIGSAEIKTFEVSQDGAFVANLRGAMIRPGTYKKIIIHGRLTMSDTPKERHDHSDFIYSARGDVLINGLGMGCCLKSVLNKDNVTSVTVIEKNSDVIELVGPHFPEANIIHADAFEFQPPKGKRYGAVWHDIWADICTDNLSDMHKLHRKYGRYCDWQGSWSRPEIERAKRYA